MLPFTKMHGLGNDCVILDARDEPIVLSGDQIRLIADRRRGVGCDQLVMLEPPKTDNADVFLRFYNSDGSESGACGNATRCIAARLMQALGVETLALQTAAGLLRACVDARGLVAIDMGEAQLDWRSIPLSHETDTLILNLDVGPYAGPSAVGMGNPHCVFFVDDADTVDVAALGPKVENNSLFPERTNVEFVTVQGRGRIRMRVWERGAGITQACGSGACAVAVAAARRGLTDRSVEIVLDGGSLFIEWRDDNHVVMSGPVAFVFTGEFDAVADAA